MKPESTTQFALGPTVETGRGPPSRLVVQAARSTWPADMARWGALSQHGSQRTDRSFRATFSKAMLLEQRPSRRPLPARNLGDESIEHAEKRALAGRVIETGPLLGP